MTKLSDPKWARIALAQHIQWDDLLPSDKIRFVAVHEYNRARQAALDSNPNVVQRVAQVAMMGDSPPAGVIEGLNEYREVVVQAAGVKSVDERIEDMYKELGPIEDPPVLVQHPDDGSYDIMWRGTSQLHVTREELNDDTGGREARARIAAKFKEIDRLMTTEGDKSS